MANLWLRTNAERLIARLESQLKTHSAPRIAKELVFNRATVLRSEGYADDVSFAKAMTEYNFYA